MVAIDKDGYFIQGVWFKGLYPPNFVGKKLIRTCPCKLNYGNDFSYSVLGRYYGPRFDDYIVLHGVMPNGAMIIEWNQRIFPDKLSELKPEWNDGNWITLDEAIQRFGDMEEYNSPTPVFDDDEEDPDEFDEQSAFDEFDALGDR